MSAVRGANFRCYPRIDLDLRPGLIGVVGPNGAGKTSLLELIHFACLAYSPRTSHDEQLVRFGSEVLRAEADVVQGSAALRCEVGYRPGEPKRAAVAGVQVRSIERLVGRFPVLVFMPDRLRLIQGPPSLRRTYFDRTVSRLWPALSPAAPEYARALAQRNHLLRRIRAGTASSGALDAWDEVTARAGGRLVAARGRLADRLGPVLGRRMAELGGEPSAAPLRHAPQTPGGERELLEALRARRQRDLERASTGVGPHLDDWELVDGGRDLRRFGSQGEQRRGLLALILAEADLIADERDEQPLLLLDDVTGEFDAARRDLLLHAVSEFEQALLTTTDEGDLAGSAVEVIAVREGRVSRA